MPDGGDNIVLGNIVFGIGYNAADIPKVVKAVSEQFRTGFKDIAVKFDTASMLKDAATLIKQAQAELKQNPLVAALRVDFDKRSSLKETRAKLNEFSKELGAMDVKLTVSPQISFKVSDIRNALKEVQAGRDFTINVRPQLKTEDLKKTLNEFALTTAKPYIIKTRFDIDVEQAENELDGFFDYVRTSIEMRRKQMKAQVRIEPYIDPDELINYVQGAMKYLKDYARGDSAMFSVPVKVNLFFTKDAINAELAKLKESLDTILNVYSNRTSDILSKHIPAIQAFSSVLKENGAALQIMAQALNHYQIARNTQAWTDTLGGTLKAGNMAAYGKEFDDITSKIIKARKEASETGNSLEQLGRRRWSIGGGVFMGTGNLVSPEQLKEIEYVMQTMGKSRAEAVRHIQEMARVNERASKNITEHVQTEINTLNRLHDAFLNLDKDVDGGGESANYSKRSKFINEYTNSVARLTSMIREAELEAHHFESALDSFQTFGKLIQRQMDVTDLADTGQIKGSRMSADLQRSLEELAKVKPLVDRSVMGFTDLNHEIATMTKQLSNGGKVSQQTMAQIESIRARLSQSKQEFVIPGSEYEKEWEGMSAALRKLEAQVDRQLGPLGRLKKEWEALKVAAKDNGSFAGLEGRLAQLQTRGVMLKVNIETDPDAEEELTQLNKLLADMAAKERSFAGLDAEIKRFLNNLAALKSDTTKQNELTVEQVTRLDHLTRVYDRLNGRVKEGTDAYRQMAAAGAAIRGIESRIDAQLSHVERLRREWTSLKAAIREAGSGEGFESKIAGLKGQAVNLRVNLQNDPNAIKELQQINTLIADIAAGERKLEGTIPGLKQFLNNLGALNAETRNATQLTTDQVKRLDQLSAEYADLTAKVKEGTNAYKQLAQAANQISRIQKVDDTATYGPPPADIAAWQSGSRNVLNNAKLSGDYSAIKAQMEELLVMGRKFADEFPAEMREAANKVQTTNNQLAAAIRRGLMQDLHELQGAANRAFLTFGEGGYGGGFRSLERLRTDLDTTKASMESMLAAGKLTRDEAARVEASLKHIDTEYIKLTARTQRLGFFTQLSNGMRMSTIASQGFLNTMGAASPMIYSAAAPIQMFTSQLGNLTKAEMAVVGPMMGIVAALGALLVAFTAVLAKGMQLEKQMQSLASLDLDGMGKSADKLNTAMDGLLGISANLPVAQQRVMETARSAQLLGVEGAERVNEFTRQITLLGEATKGVSGSAQDIDQLAETVAKFLNETGAMDRGQDAYIANMKEVVNVVAALDQAVPGTIKDMFELAKYMGSASKELNMSRTEVLAFSAGLAGMGANAQGAGSSIVAVLMKMNSELRSGSNYFKNYARMAGVTTEEFGKLVRQNPAVAFEKLAGGMHKAVVAGASLDEIAASLNIKNKQDIRIIANLSAGHHSISKAIEAQVRALTNKNIIMERVNTANHNAIDLFKILGNRISTLAAVIGVDFARSLTTMLDGTMANTKGWISFGETMYRVAHGAAGMFDILVTGFRVVALAITAALESLVNFVSALKDPNLWGSVNSFLQSVKGYITHDPMAGVNMQLAQMQAKTYGESAFGKDGYFSKERYQATVKQWDDLVKTANATVAHLDAAFEPKDNNPGLQKFSKQWETILKGMQNSSKDWGAADRGRFPAGGLDDGYLDGSAKASDKYRSQVEYLQRLFDSHQLGETEFKNKLAKIAEQMRAAIAKTKVQSVEWNDLMDYRNDILNKIGKKGTNTFAEQIQDMARMHQNAVLSDAEYVNRLKNIINQVDEQLKKTKAQTQAWRDLMDARTSALSAINSVNKTEARDQKKDATLTSRSNEILSKITEANQKMAQAVQSGDTDLNGKTVEAYRTHVNNLVNSLNKLPAAYRGNGMALRDEAVQLYNNGRALAANNAQRKEAEKRADLVTRMRNSLQDMRTWVENGDKGGNGAQGRIVNFQQALASFAKEANKLSPELRKNLNLLFDEGNALTINAQKAVDAAKARKEADGLLKTSKGWSYDELVAARNRAQNNIGLGIDVAKNQILLKGLDAQIAELDKKAAAAQEKVNSSQLQLREGEIKTRMKAFEQALQDSNDDVQEQLQLWKSQGSQYILDQSELINNAADQAKQGIRDTYAPLLEANKRNKTAFNKLNEQMNQELQDVDANTTAQLTNLWTNFYRDMETLEDKVVKVKEKIIEAGRVANAELTQSNFKKQENTDQDTLNSYQNSLQDALEDENLRGAARLAVIEYWQGLIKKANQRVWKDQKDAAIAAENERWRIEQKRMEDDNASAEEVTARTIIHNNNLLAITSNFNNKELDLQRQQNSQLAQGRKKATQDRKDDVQKEIDDIKSTYSRLYADNEDFDPDNATDRTMQLGYIQSVINRYSVLGAEYKDFVDFLLKERKRLLKKDESYASTFADKFGVNATKDGYNMATALADVNKLVKTDPVADAADNAQKPFTDMIERFKGMRAEADAMWSKMTATQQAEFRAQYTAWASFLDQQVSTLQNAAPKAVAAAKEKAGLNETMQGYSNNTNNRETLYNAKVIDKDTYRAGLVADIDLYQKLADKYRDNKDAVDLYTAALKGLLAAQQNLKSFDSGESETQKNIETAWKNVNSAEDKLHQAMGYSDISRMYEGEIDQLRNMAEQYEKTAPLAAARLKAVADQYERMQKARANWDFRNDFKAGFDGGETNLNNAAANFAKSLGAAVNPLNLFAGVVGAINPQMLVLNGFLEAFSPIIEVLTEAFTDVGYALGQLLLPFQQILIPVIKVLANLFIAVADAIGSLLQIITLGLYKKPDTSRRSEDAAAPVRKQNESDQLDLDRDRKLVDDEEYYRRKYEMYQRYAATEMDKEIKAAKGNEILIAAIRDKYRIADEKARREMLQNIMQVQLANSAKLAERETKELERRRKYEHLTDEEYAQQKYESLVAQIERERAIEIAAAEGNEAEIAAINDKYNEKLLDANNELVDSVQAKWISMYDNLRGGFLSSFKNMLKSAIQKGNFSEFRDGLRSEFGSAVLDAMLGAITDNIILTVIKPALDKLITALADDVGGVMDQNDAEAIDGLNVALDQASAIGRRAFKAIEPFRRKLGINDPIQLGNADESIFSNSDINAKVDFSSPDVKVSFEMLSYLADTIKAEMPRFVDGIASFVSIEPALKNFATMLDMAATKGAEMLDRKISSNDRLVSALDNLTNTINNAVNSRNVVNSPSNNSGASMPFNSKDIPAGYIPARMIK